ncbi:hypothetical protein [Algoriphagus sp. A40]|uniref:hypothetical protein n=1 Tax=Algoriphagus sp. A40 TaxID=1945863 RepID=UPI001115A0C3|nr:hypothetical protein [Algoriphagus sp. A40]
MFLRLPHVLANLLMPLWLIWGLIFEIPIGLDSVGSHAEHFPNEKISVRESTVDLQVTVGHRIFVFGKAKGTMEKVKVGMNVLPFTQVPGAQGSDSFFTKVSWKKLKDGSIQVQSSYNPWPLTLTWTVFANGQLKMEASAPVPNLKEENWLGLGFDYPEHQLYQISWIGDGTLTSENRGNWKNMNFTAMADPEIKEVVNSQGLFQKFQSIKFEFESVVVDVRTETPDVYFGFGQAGNQGSSYPAITSDLGFLLNNPQVSSQPLPQTPGENNFPPNPVSLNPLVLWFHFQ